MTEKKKAEKESRIGRIRFPKTIKEYLMEVLEDFDFPGGKKTREIIEKIPLPIAFIKAGKDIFHVREEDGKKLEKNFSDGNIVKFYSKGKNHWAHEIGPVIKN